MRRSRCEVAYKLTGICITLFFTNEVHDPVFKFLYFILFSITVFNWFTDLIGAHSDITLFLLRDGVQGANKMLAYICYLLSMYMVVVFTTRFEMLSVFIVAGQRS